MQIIFTSFSIVRDNCEHLEGIIVRNEEERGIERILQMIDPVSLILDSSNLKLKEKEKILGIYFW